MGNVTLSKTLWVGIKFCVYERATQGLERQKSVRSVKASDVVVVKTRRYI